MLDGAQIDLKGQEALYEEYETALADLNAAKDSWARTSVPERMRLLEAMKPEVLKVSKAWVNNAARKKLVDPDSHIGGEEWFAGPWALMSGINSLLTTFSQFEGKKYLDHIPTRELVTGQLALKVMPHSIWDHILFSGLKAEIWMQKGVNEANLKKNSAIVYDIPEKDRKGKVSLVLGAGNIAAITPLDVFQKLFLENQVVILKMNPVNDFLTDHYKVAMKPLIDANVLRIVRGDAKGGAYLCEHPIIEELHITGAASTHDAIVWGTGEEGEKNRKAGTPKNTKRFTSELGGVGPVIVVPGPWTKADLKFQAEQIATMKLHNSGHNCVACQTLIMSKGWNKGEKLLSNLKKVAEGSVRPAWYPGAEQRVNTYAGHTEAEQKVQRGKLAPPLVIGQMGADDFNEKNEVFGPAMGVKELDAQDPEAFLKAAIDYANNELWGTLGANILIHPRTIRKIGKKRFEELVAGLKYGTIGINGWCAYAFLITVCPWGAYPGHTIEDVQSGIGAVHNSLMLEHTERTVVTAPWRPFPRGLLSLNFALLPKPPIFITNRRQHKLGEHLTDFAYKPSWFKLPRIFVHALLG